MSESSYYSGQFGTYNTGGFIQNLGQSLDETTNILNFLQSNNWIDRGTRAVFLDLTTYNANLNLFCQIK
jgi:polycystin 1